MDYEQEIKELRAEIERLKEFASTADQRYASRRFVKDIADLLEETNKKLNEVADAFRGKFDMLFDKVFPGLGKTMDQIKHIIGADGQHPPTKPPV